LFHFSLDLGVGRDEDRVMGLGEDGDNFMSPCSSLYSVE